MKTLLKKLIILAVIVTIAMVGIVCFDYFVVGSQYQLSHQAALIDKVNRMKSIDEPKIMLVGNSNVTFGMDSEMLEKELGMPVVDLGLHAALGNPYLEQIAKLDIDAGDIVVICHSNYSDDDTISDNELAWITYDFNEELWPIIRKKDYKDFILAYPAYCRRAFMLWLTGMGNKDSGDCYSRTAFNEYGDIVFRPIEDQYDVDKYFSMKPVGLPGINETCINRLNELNSYCEERGAKMVVAGYPIAYGEYTTFSLEDVNVFQESLAEKLDCEVISDYRDYLYPYNDFYNSYLHLTEEGARKRTLQLSKDIKAWKETYKG